MLLSLISAETKTLFAESFKNHPLKKMNVITCMATLKKTVSDANAPSCLILGTENQEAYILEIDAYTILSTVRPTTTTHHLFIFINESILSLFFLVFLAGHPAQCASVHRGEWTVRRGVPHSVCLPRRSHLPDQARLQQRPPVHSTELAPGGPSAHRQQHLRRLHGPHAEHLHHQGQSSVEHEAAGGHHHHGGHFPRAPGAAHHCGGARQQEGHVLQCTVKGNNEGKLFKVM